MTKIEGSGSISQRYGTADPDPYQNLKAPHRRKGKNLISSPWDEKEDLDGLVVPAPRHESLRHVGHEVAHVVARLSQLTPAQLHVNSLTDKMESCMKKNVYSAYQTTEIWLNM
jgi:hypothetical protein